MADDDVTELAQEFCPGQHLLMGGHQECVGVARDLLASHWIVQHDAHIRAEVLRDAADEWTQGEWANHLVTAADPAQIRIGSANRFGEWLRARAGRIEAGEQP